MGRIVLLLLLCAFSWVVPSTSSAESGPGLMSHAPHDPLTPEQRAAIQAEIEANRARLRAEGRLASPGQLQVAGALTLEWPLQAAAGYTDPGYHAISGFVDHDPAFPGQRLDYECGARTYDTAGGYNHTGVDIFPWPYLWNSMDAGTVEIIAAAPGVIVYKQDGEFDRSCGFNGNPWNAVYIEHADGSVAWYGHMKNGSVTTKPIGASVVTGEVLGLIGSSGNSTGPHLHFEIQDASTNVVDPYAGTCNPISSLWSSQRPYYDSAINKIATQSAPAVLSLCDGPDQPNLSDVFAQGDTVWFSAFYRDELNTQTSTYTVHRPDDSVFATWTRTIAPAHQFISLAEYDHVLPYSAPVGTWRYEVDYEGVTYQHTFEVVPLYAVPGLAPHAFLVLAGALALTGRGLSSRPRG